MVRGSLSGKMGGRRILQATLPTSSLTEFHRPSLTASRGRLPFVLRTSEEQNTEYTKPFYTEPGELFKKAPRLFCERGVPRGGRERGKIL